MQVKMSETPTNMQAKTNEHKQAKL